MATQIKTVGTGKDYTTLASWETAAGTSSTTTDPWWAECYSFDLGNVVITGWSNPPTAEGHRVKIYADSSAIHDGSFTTSGARIEASNSNVIDVNHDFITIEGLRVTCTHANGVAVRANPGVNDLIINKCLFENTAGGSGGNGIVYLNTSTSTNSHTVTNCVIQNTYRGIRVRVSAGGTSTEVIQNNSIYSCNLYGIEIDGAGTEGVTLENNIAMDSTTADFQETNAPTSRTYNNNLSSDSTSDNFGGSNHIVDEISTNVWTNPSGEDFTLKAGSAAIDAGKTLATVTDDVKGQARPQGASYDIGAFELVGGGGGGGGGGGDGYSVDIPVPLKSCHTTFKKTDNVK